MSAQLIMSCAKCLIVFSEHIFLNIVELTTSVVVHVCLASALSHVRYITFCLFQFFNIFTVTSRTTLYCAMCLTTSIVNQTKKQQIKIHFRILSRAAFLPQRIERSVIVLIHLCLYKLIDLFASFSLAFSFSFSCCKALNFVVKII